MKVEYSIRNQFLFFRCPTSVIYVKSRDTDTKNEYNGNQNVGLFEWFTPLVILIIMYGSRTPA